MPRHSAAVDTGHWRLDRDDVRCRLCDALRLDQAAEPPWIRAPQAKQAAFIAAYESLLNSLEADEAVVFADAVHPTHGVRPVGCWAPKEVKIAVEQASGRRIRLHFVPAYCPHLNPIERLWGAMHKAITHNQCYAIYGEFCHAVLRFLRDDVPAQ